MINISIIIPFYNRLELVEKAIISIVRQTASNWELILVDDGTTENGVEELIAKYSSEKIRFLKRDRQPKGAPTCRNIGADNARFDYLFFFDSDDIMAPWAIEERTKIVEKHIDKDFFIFDIISIYDDTIASRTIQSIPDPLFSFLKFQATWGTPCVVWRKETLFEISGWDENAVCWQDGEVHVRLLLKNNNYYWDNSSLPDVFVRIHDDRISAESNMNKLINRFEIYNTTLELMIAQPFYYNHFRKMIELILYKEIEFGKKEDIKEIRALVKSNKIIIQNKTTFLLYSKLYEMLGYTKIIKWFFWQLRRIGIPNKRIVFFNERKLYTELEIQQLKQKLKNDEFIRNEFLFFKNNNVNLK